MNDAVFIGFCIEICNNNAHVSLFNQDTGERFEADCEAAILQQQGITVGAEFSCEVKRRENDTVVEFAILSPKHVSAAELEQISTDVDSRR